MHHEQPFRIDRIETPIGELLIVSDSDGKLRAVDWLDHESRMRDYLRIRYGADVLSRTSAGNAVHLTRPLQQYFQGDLKAIDTLPVHADGTPFQREVWAALRTIPCGTSTSYAALARQIGRPAAVRAVGMANGSNPISIVVPCHRVIGADGSLTGYGGGLHRKSWLLAHEGCEPTRKEGQRSLF
jgi:methylated-DNA-[protein]-cysteine S-methyltransferase